jgi:basic amino acid/polyamine antiporter, APA family
MVKGPRRLNFLDVFCLGLNAIVGSGIFLFPGRLAALAGPASIAAFLVCALLLSSVALCYAELSAMFAENGATYLYAREAFGERVGYGVGFLSWATSALSWSAVASVLAAHAAYFHPVFAVPSAQKASAGLVIVFFGLLNYRGVKPGARAVDLLTFAKLIPLLLFVACGLTSVDPGRYSPFYGGQMRFGYAVFLALWPLQGFEAAPVPAGETGDPQRDIPRAVLGSLLSAAVIYAAVQAVAVGTFAGLASSSQRPLADAAAGFMGPLGAALMAAGGIVSMTGFIAGEALGAPRYLSALGSRSLLALRLGAVHPRYETPHRAIAVTTATSLALVVSLDFSSLIDISNLAVVCQYLAACLALWALRVRRPQAPRPYRVPWAWAVVPVGCLTSLWLMTQVSRPELFAVAVVLVVGYLLRRGVSGTYPPERLTS